MSAPELLNYYCASDYATQEDEGDFTEHGCFGIDKQNEVWIVDWFYGQVTTDVGIDELLKMKKRNHAIKGFGEKGVIRHAIEPAFKRRQKDLKIRMKVEYLTTAGSKAARALSWQSLARSGMVHIPLCPWGERLIEQLCDFPGRAADDGVDVCAIFGRAFEHLRWSRALVPPKERAYVRFGSWEWLESGTEEKTSKKKRRF